MATLPQQRTIDQYIADGASTVFVYSYLILLNTDIAVYETLSGNLPNPPGDIKTLNVDYTVQGVGTTGGGTVTFTVAPAAGTIVTLARAIQETITTNYSVASTISGVNLDSSFQRCVLISQQIQSQVNAFCIQYPVDYYNPGSLNNIAPPLADGQVWTGLNGGLAATTIENDVNVSVLRSQLASATSGAPGAALIGFYNTITSTPTTVNAQLVSIDASIVALDEFQSGIGTIVDSGNSGNQTFTTTGVAKNMASISITAGTWDVYFYAAIVNGTVPAGITFGSISETSGVIPESSGTGTFYTNSTTASLVNSYSGQRQIIASGTETIYLVGSSQFTGTNTGYVCQLTASKVK